MLHFRRGCRARLWAGWRGRKGLCWMPAPGQQRWAGLVVRHRRRHRAPLFCRGLQKKLLTPLREIFEACLAPGQQHILQDLTGGDHTRVDGGAVGSVEQRAPDRVAASHACIRQTTIVHHLGGPTGLSLARCHAWLARCSATVCTSSQLLCKAAYAAVCVAPLPPGPPLQVRVDALALEQPAALPGPASPPPGPLQGRGRGRAGGGGRGGHGGRGEPPGGGGGGVVLGPTKGEPF